MLCLPIIFSSDTTEHKTSWFLCGKLCITIRREDIWSNLEKYTNRSIERITSANDLIYQPAIRDGVITAKKDRQMRRKTIGEEKSARQKCKMRKLLALVSITHRIGIYLCKKYFFIAQSLNFEKMTNVWYADIIQIILTWLYSQIILLWADNNFLPS